MYLDSLSRLRFTPGNLRRASTIIYLLVFSWAIEAGFASTTLIPQGRVAPWVSGVTVGVPGGIPNRSTIFASLTGIDTTGTTNVQPAINAALASCPNGQVVYLPAGHYRLDSQLTIPSGVVLRGAGSSTVLDSYNPNGYGLIVFGSVDWPPPNFTLNVTSGAVVGSSNITLNATTGVTVNRLVQISENTPDYVWVGNGVASPLSSFHLVTAINGNTVSIWPPLPLTLTNSPQVATYPQHLCTGVGIENLKVNLTNSTLAAIESYQTWGCWITNVEVAGTSSKQMFLDYFNMGSVVGCYTHDALSSGPSHEGIDFYGWGCWNLIENNMSHRGGFPAIMLGDSKGGCVGNVVAYNFVDDTDSGSGVAGCSIDVNHGPFNMFNLVEGNVCQMIQSDGYYGGCGFTTLFRNYCSGAYSGAFAWPRCIDLTHYSYWFTVVGNVLGTNDRAFAYSTEQNGYNGNPLVYRFGYPNMGNMGWTGINTPGTFDTPGGLDPTVKSNVLLIANYDCATGGVVNPTNGLPPSLYRNVAPAWWGTTRWPAIDPTTNQIVVPIPAQLRYLGITGGTNKTTRAALDPPSGLQVISSSGG
jgi:hypothetical protein